MTKIAYMLALFLVVALAATGIATAANTGGHEDINGAGNAACNEPGGTCVIADFIGSPTEGTAPLHVQFLDSSTGYPTMWTWDFGDGKTESGNANPIHVYTEPGIYTVTLTVNSASGGSSTKIRQRYITVRDKSPLEADFLAHPTYGKAPLLVQFTDCSKGAVKEWKWDFGDGSKGYEQNPSHIYQRPGKYTVTLTVSSPTAGTSTKVKEKYIIVEGGCVIEAKFRADPPRGPAPLTVKFTDLSVGQPTMWAWDFGDGESDMVASPTHTYKNPGTYVVRLSASSQDCEPGYAEAKISVGPRPIKADFTADPRTGEVPLTVKFKDLSKGQPTTWKWDFGDGATEVIANPTHTYTSPGTYTVTLTASNRDSSDMISKSEFVTVSPKAIRADFSADPRSGEVPLTVRFTDLSTGNPTMWAWDFGDGTTDMVANPTHTYTKPGTYTVTLTASNQYASDTVSKSEFVTVSPKAIRADFTGEPRAGEIPLTVQFTDLSTGNPTMWAWDFGDGTTDMVASPTHTYTKPGTYTVTLTASNQYASDTISKSEFVTAKDLRINADFTGTPTEGYAPLAVAFKDLSTGKPTMWAWDFGDGTTDMVANPTHTYTKPGTYTVSMTASSQYGASDSEVKQGYITVRDKTIVADFEAKPRSGCAPLTVLFTDKSTNNPTMWAWDFGDGTTDMVGSPSHTYTKPGTYTVTLTASNQYGGSDTVTKQGLIVVEDCPPLKADFDGVPRTGTAPLSVTFTDKSSGKPTTWAWDFGDGSSDVVANPVHTYTKEGKYTVTLTASNKRGSDMVSKSEFITVSPAYDDKIPVSSGWNFISVPKKLAAGADTAAIFDCVDSAGHSMFQYDAGKHLWNVLDPESPIKPLEGFWIYSKGTSYVPIRYDHNPVQTPPVAYLKKGWNGIGFTGATPIEAKYTLLSVQDKWVNCVGFNAPSQQYDQMIIKGSNDATLMYPFRGYWLYMTADGTLAANAA